MDDGTISESLMDKISDELFVKILSYVPHDNYLNLRLVDHRFNEVSKEPSLWKKVDLGFPRTHEQISFMTTYVFPGFADKLTELRITGFLDIMTDFWDDTEPRTLTSEVLHKIKASCPQLKTFIIRKCRFIDSEPDFLDNLPDTLEKLEFDSCRLPDLPSSWIVQMTDDGARPLLENLTTVKFQKCTLDMQLVSYIAARPSLTNLTLRQSCVGIVVLHFLIPGPPSPTISENLKVLDLSGMRPDSLTMFVDEWVLDNVHCNVTHLYMENCQVIPRRLPRLPNHLKIEYLSVAGYTGSGHVYGPMAAIHYIEVWAALPSMKEMNASGCRMTETQRNSLKAANPNVLFNLDVDFKESPRVKRNLTN